MELRALGKVKMFGKYYLSGQALPEVDEAEAIRLMALGVAEEITGAVSAAPAAAAQAPVVDLPPMTGSEEAEESLDLLLGTPPAALVVVGDLSEPVTGDGSGDALPPLGDAVAEALADAVENAVEGPDLPPAKEPEAMTKAELLAELTELKIQHDPKASKAALAKQLRAVLDSSDTF